MAKIKILVGTVYGGARDVADGIKPVLEQKGYQVDITEDPALSDLTDPDNTAILISVSTTGSGDFPPGFDKFYFSLNDQGASLGHLKYGVIALGDSSYDTTFCEAGRKIDNILAEYGATRVGRRLDIDSAEHFDAIEPAISWIEDWTTRLV
ncbi:flavodoxin [Oceanospirillum sediminis]|uniref:Flavodoxin n=1 Tax=Oceanospirillum sediminis TaxID=2760088 RepID=A0A839IW87_9GAMM|nr:flavodoxin [Oceanospirillum sediminis]MBB1488950.1 flavodoxin [Oceanospirillum sediminis]